MLDLMATEGLSRRNWIPQGSDFYTKQVGRCLDSTHSKRAANDIADCLCVQYLKIHLDTIHSFWVIDETEQVYTISMQSYLDGIGEKLNKAKIISGG